jgi:glycosyltransferase involved in cell wall biosynthesis
MLERPAYLRARLAKADALVAPTRFLYDVHVENGVPAGRLHHLTYGVDAAGLAGDVARQRGSGRPTTFGFIGSFAEHKGPHVLVDALRRVSGDCRAILRGRSTDFADYSTRLSEAAGRDPRITLQEPFARERLAEALAAIDVLVVPSTWHENAPFVVLEARAAGLPVLASRFGGLVEVVRDEVDGELFAPGDAADLARRLQRLLDEPARLARYRAAVRPPKSLATAVDEFETLYAGARAHGAASR